MAKKTIPVETSIGEIVVNFFTVDDFIKVEVFQKKGMTPEEIGKAVLQRMLLKASSLESLSDQELSSLSDKDVASLIVAAKDMLASDDGEATYESLGRSLVSEYESMKGRFDKISESYSFLNKGTYSKLNSAMAVMEDMQRTMGRLKIPVVPTHSHAGAAVSALGHTQALALAPVSVSALPKLPEMPSLDSWAISPPKLDSTKDLLDKIDFSNSPGNRSATAAEGTLEQVKELAVHMEAMAAQTGDLSRLFLEEVFPQWIDYQKGSSQATENSLKWARNAVFVAIGTAALQIAISIWGAFNSGDDERIDRLIGQQLQISAAINSSLSSLAENTDSRDILSNIEALLKEQSEQAAQTQELLRRTVRESLSSGQSNASLDTAVPLPAR